MIPIDDSPWIFIEVCRECFRSRERVEYDGHSPLCRWAEQ